MSDKPLGRRPSPNLDHVAAYPLAALIADPSSSLAVPPPGTEVSLGLPWWWKDHDQGAEGACVGFGSSAMMSITNHLERLENTGKDVTYRYASRWLYLEAQLVDEWDDTPPEEGTSVRAACDILKTQGHRRVQSGSVKPVSLEHGIAAYRWAQNVDEVRAAIYAGLAVSIGILWYENFDNPVRYNNELWIGRAANLGSVRGGHCVCIYRMSDRRKGFRIMNSWGAAYPPVWVSYDVTDRLIDEWGEFAVITDR